MQKNFGKNYEEIDCCVCGVIFLIPEVLKNGLMESKGAFYCPNGHSITYKKSTSEKIREELEAEKIKTRGRENYISTLEIENKKLLKKNNKKTKI